jgi:hypothetical protein
LLYDASQEIGEVLSQVLEELYRPKSGSARAALQEVFLGPERAYFKQWNEAEIERVHKAPPPGELHLGPLFGDSPGAPGYIAEPYLNTDGRKAYRQALLAAYDSVAKNAGDFEAEDRVGRLKQCIIQAVADIDTFAAGKGQAV